MLLLFCDVCIALVYNNVTCALFLPVNVHMPKDRVTQMHQGYGFVEFMGEEDADYSIKIMNMIKLYGKPIRVNKVCTLFFCTILFYFLKYF
jgi:RNA recognition motif-containing protein